MIPRLEPNGRKAVIRYGRKPSKPGKRRNYAERVKGEPWQKSAYGRAYRARRQAVIEKAGGRCQRCGKPVAHLVNGVWRTKGGEVHHTVPLAQGGEGAPMVLLCIPCHRRIDAQLRRQRRQDGS